MAASIAGPLGQKSVQFWALVALVIVTFLIGGGSKDDIASLVWLRPFAALMLCGGLVTLTAGQARSHRFLLGLAAVIAGLIVLHLIPLPPAVWQALPGRGLIAEIDGAAGLAGTWRPLTLAPTGTWNALFALLPPAAALVLAVQLSSSELRAMVPVLLFIGAAAVLVALLQIGGPTDGPLYFYQFTNTGSPVGLFANRNHQAAFLVSLLPMLFIYATASDGGPARRFQLILALFGGLLVVPLVMVTGSRAGMALAVIALLLLPLLNHGRDRLPQDRWASRLPVAGALFLIVLVGLAYALGRAEAIERFTQNPSGADPRSSAWGPMLDMAWTYFPAGSGIGSFAKVFTLDEPYALLALTSFAHAHNDWLETMITAGLPGLMIVAAAIAGLAIAAKAAWWTSHAGSADVRLGRLGLFVILLLGLASITDYPLRVPSLACLFAIAAVWAAQAVRGARD